jgi:hypothetical protein
VNADLIERLETAAKRLDTLAEGLTYTEANSQEYTRLRGKAEGVRLALTYVTELGPLDGVPVECWPYRVIGHTDGNPDHQEGA